MYIILQACVLVISWEVLNVCMCVCGMLSCTYCTIRWLIKRNKLQKAHKILLRIFGNEDEASSCVSDITASINESHVAWRACMSLDFLQR